MVNFTCRPTQYEQNSVRCVAQTGSVMPLVRISHMVSCPHAFISVRPFTRV